jgi:hypothetical protein
VLQPVVRGQYVAFRELNDARQQQTATTDVPKVIGRSALS